MAAVTPLVRDRVKTALDTAGHRAMVVTSLAQLLAQVRADFDEYSAVAHLLPATAPHLFPKPATAGRTLAC